jgi:hypothetical protein
MNSDIYMEKWVELYSSSIGGSPSINMNVSFNFIPLSESLTFGNASARIVPVGVEEYLFPPGLELDCVLMASSDGVFGALYFKKALFEKESIAPIAMKFMETVKRGIENPSFQLSTAS